MHPNLKMYYRQLLKTASSINNYNFKQFAIRKIKNDFKSISSLDNNKIADLQAELDQLKRIQTITQLYCINHHPFNVSDNSEYIK
jgi:hypothetical protein